MSKRKVNTPFGEQEIEDDPLIPSVYKDNGYNFQLTQEELALWYRDEAVRQALARTQGIDLSNYGMKSSDPNCIATATSNYPRSSFVTGNQTFVSNLEKYGFERVQDPELGDLVQFWNNQQSPEDMERFNLLYKAAGEARDAYEKLYYLRHPDGSSFNENDEPDLYELWKKREDAWRAVENFKGSGISLPTHMEIITGFTKDGRPLKSGTGGEAEYRKNTTFLDKKGENPNIRYYRYVLAPDVLQSLMRYQKAADKWWLENAPKPQTQIIGIDVLPIDPGNILIKQHRHGGLIYYRKK